MPNSNARAPRLSTMIELAEEVSVSDMSEACSKELYHVKKYVKDHVFPLPLLKFVSGVNTLEMEAGPTSSLSKSSDTKKS